MTVKMDMFTSVLSVSGEIDPVVTVVGIFLIVLLIGLSAFFSSSEIALFSLSKYRIESLASEGSRNAEKVKKLREDPHRSLVTILIGNNISNIAMSSIATGLLSFYFNPSESILIATFGITSLVLLFGESAPKSYAVENAESWAMRIAGPLQLTQYVLYPLVVVFDYLTDLINRITGVHGNIETAYVTRSEIQEAIKTGEQQGVIEPDEAVMLHQVFEFTDTIAREVMTPRAEIVAVSKDMEIEDAIQKSVGGGYTRLPVYSDSLDDVIGSVHIRDLMKEPSQDSEIEDVLQPVLTVPETKDVDELLTEIREKRINIAIVVDEFGNVTGLVTTEDLIEEIVGELLRRGEIPPIEMINEGSALIRGDVNIEEINERLGTNLPESDRFDTIAGFILDYADRLVDEGEKISYDNLEIKVRETQGSRIVRVEITKHDGGLKTIDQ